MTLKGCIKYTFLVCGLLFVCNIASAQITSGKITFERKTNLKKMFKDDDRVKGMGVDLDTRIENFELYFNDTASAFMEVPSGEDLGWGKMLTSHNQFYKNRVTNEKLVVMEMMGRQMYIRDSITPRQWKVTEKKRKLAGYLCRRAIWEMNDSTRIYAWFSVDIVPSIGPEGFDGLPGGILGLATEDGSIIYFASKVEEMEPTAEVMVKNTGKAEVYSQEELKALLIERMGKWVKPKDLDAMFTWL